MARLLTLGTLAVAVLGLAGCSGEDQPKQGDNPAAASAQAADPARAQERGRTSPQGRGGAAPRNLRGP